MSKLSNKEYVAQIYNGTYIYISKFLTIKCRNTDDVPDMLQNVYTNFMARVERFGQAHILTPKHYLLRIAKDELAKTYKKKNSDKQIDSIDEIQDEYEIIDEQFLMEDFVENSMMGSMIWEKIKELDDCTVKIIILRHKYEMH